MNIVYFVNVRLKNDDFLSQMYIYTLPEEKSASLVVGEVYNLEVEGKVIGSFKLIIIEPKDMYRSVELLHFNYYGNSDLGYKTIYLSQRPIHKDANWAPGLKPE